MVEHPAKRGGFNFLLALLLSKPLVLVCQHMTTSTESY